MSVSLKRGLGRVKDSASEDLLQRAAETIFFNYSSKFGVRKRYGDDAYSAVVHAVESIFGKDDSTAIMERLEKISAEAHETKTFNDDDFII